MRINKIINKIEAPPPLFQERVAFSIRLEGAKGSAAERKQLANSLSEQFFKILDNAFLRRKKMNKPQELTPKALLSCIKKVLPEKNIKVKFEKKSNYQAYVENVFNKPQTTIVGLALSLRGGAKKGKCEGVLKHEMQHIFDEVTQPKILARNNTSTLIGKLPGYSEECDMFHYDYYMGHLYAPRNFEDDNRELSELKKGINTHFEELLASREEKIEVLQKWRVNMKMELDAYRTEGEYMCKEDPDKFTKENFGDFFFEGKIKLVEEILKDEIAAARKLNAEKFGKK